MSRKYFITSDVHSFYDELRKALDRNGFDVTNKEHYLCICGDIFDRGNKSKEVFEFLKKLGDRFIFIRGNHEDLLADCVTDICSGSVIRSHHYSNGTVRTISHFTGIPVDEFYYKMVRRDNSFDEKVYNSMKPVLDWIDTKSIHYAEIGDYILVHGWIPVTGEDIDFRGNYIHPKAVPQDKWGELSDFQWRDCTWLNGMEMWKKGVRIPDKTIICGHFHSSWGHSHIHQDRKEFPDKSRVNWKKSFEPFVDEGIIAIDSCCAYSGFLNCIVLEL